MSKYRLSLDIGTNSIGWCALGLQEDKDNKRLKPVSILDMGVRIYPDGRNPKDGSSNAAERRAARSMRRNRDRFVDRRNRLLDILTEFGLMPANENDRHIVTNLDPYELRKKGLDERLTVYEIGRALFHLNQRRGFKSNRKSDTKDKDTGIIKTVLRDQQLQMEEAGARSFGEYLYLRREEGLDLRSRKKTKVKEEKEGKQKKEDYYDFYPKRELLEEEFSLLWQAQSKHHPNELSDTAREKIHHAIFFQRDLKPQAVGKCTFEHTEDRAPKALPMVQRFRIYQELNNLHILDLRTLKGKPLTLEQRDQLAGLLCQPNGKKSGSAQVTFDKMRRTLHLGGGTVFSHESEKRKGLEGDTVSALMAQKDRFGARWYELDEDQQEQVIGALLYLNDEEELIQLLMEDWGLDRSHAEECANTPLPDGHGRLGLTATRKITAELIKEVIPYSEAVVRAGYASHSQFDTGDRRERLPYYGEVLERHVVPDPLLMGHPAARLEKRYGKVTNPTVHIALNQVRKVVNEIIKRYGSPAEVHVEVLRDLKNSFEQKKEIQKLQSENQARNEACVERLREEFHLAVNRENIQRLRLWEELGAANRVCVYSGEVISAEILFTEKVEIDHILPISRTLDDSMANKILCMRRANRDKSNQTPFEAWGSAPEWPEILDRSSLLPKNKRWRFAEDAMERYMKDKDFIARQLTDSQYIARLTREYLACLFNPGEGHRVVCLPGRLTGMYRHHLGLDTILDEINPSRKHDPSTRGEKNRNDHRNHTVDAVVVGLMDRAFLQRTATLHARHEREGVEGFLADFPEPWDEFRAETREALKKVIVSHKPDHGIEGVLHNDTAYGISKVEDPRGNAIHRIAVQDIKVNSILAIRGKRLRAELMAHLSGSSYQDAFGILEELENNKRKGKNSLVELCGGDEKVIIERAKNFLLTKGIRRVRLVEQIPLVLINNKQGVPYKGFKTDGNAYLNIFRIENNPNWNGELVTRFNANAKKTGRKPDIVFADKGLDRIEVIRLFNRDMIEMEHEGERRIFYIQFMSEKLIGLAEHFEANADSRNRDKEDPFKFVYKGSAESIRKSKARFLSVTPSGMVRYLSDDPDDHAGD